MLGFGVWKDHSGSSVGNEAKMGKTRGRNIGRL